VRLIGIVFLCSQILSCALFFVIWLCWLFRSSRHTEEVASRERTPSMLTRKTFLLAIVPIVANWATPACAQTAGMNRRQDRRGDRQDCRQQEGLVGADKRNCKQQGRQTR
jgi:hypothetical protein